MHRAKRRSGPGYAVAGVSGNSCRALGAQRLTARRDRLLASPQATRIRQRSSLPRAWKWSRPGRIHGGGSGPVKSWNILVTGSGGLIGSEAVEYFDRQGHRVVGVDNNMRREFFGPPGDTLWNLKRLKNSTRHFTPVALDIRDREGVMALFRENRFDLIIHCAAQPSHDKAADIALLDFEVNAMGTVNLLEATRQHCRDAAFIFMSTNKVYGDAPNERPLRETETRFDYSDPADFEGIDENCRIDRTLHSLFGASKVAADIYAQEYGRYFGMSVGIFRGGCLTGPS